MTGVTYEVSKLPRRKRSALIRYARNGQGEIVAWFTSERSAQKFLTDTERL